MITDDDTPLTRSRSDRDTARDALDVLEEALAAPTPGRERHWRDNVAMALDHFVASLDSQAGSDLGPGSLLSEIGNDHPRLLTRIQRLHDEHHDLRIAAASLRRQIAGPAGDADEFAKQIDTADIRDRLSQLGRRYRQHRARESDLVYEAINVDLGAGD